MDLGLLLDRKTGRNYIWYIPETFLDWSLPHMLSLTTNIRCIEPRSLFFSKASSKKLFSQILKKSKAGEFSMFLMFPLTSSSGKISALQNAHPLTWTLKKTAFWPGTCSLCWKRGENKLTQQNPSPVGSLLDSAEKVSSCCANLHSVGINTELN